MKLKDRVKSYSFWVSLASAVILVIKLIGQKYGLLIDETFISDLFTAICGILVILGIIVVPKTETNSNCSDSNNQIIETVSTGEELIEAIENEIIQTNTTTSNLENAENSIAIQIEALQNNDNLSNDNQGNNLSEITNFDSSQSFEEQENLNFNSDAESIKQSGIIPTIIGDIDNQINEFDILKQHINELINKEKERYLNNFSEYKKILLDEINKIDE